MKTVTVTVYALSELTGRALIFFSDSYLEERAAECDYYFTAAGKLFIGEAA